MTIIRSRDYDETVTRVKNNVIFERANKEAGK